MLSIVPDDECTDLWQKKLKKHPPQIRGFSMRLDVSSEKLVLDKVFELDFDFKDFVNDNGTFLPKDDGR